MTIINTPLVLLAQQCGATYYTPGPMRAIRGMAFTFDQLDALAERLRAKAVPAVAAPQSEYPPLPDPDSYLFQHEDTGLTQYVEAQQVEWGFEKNNPRWKKCEGVFSESQLRAYFELGSQRATTAEPDFWTWIRLAYREPESTQYTVHNMEVAYQAGRAAAPAVDALDAVRQAVRDYHNDLDKRSHGGIAASHAIDAIQAALGMAWTQGAEAAARAVQAREGGAD